MGWGCWYFWRVAQVPFESWAAENGLHGESWSSQLQENEVTGLIYGLGLANSPVVRGGRLFVLGSLSS
jgi:hypothetical protein